MNIHTTRRLGLLLLTSFVVTSMIGGGAFNLPHDMATGAGLGAIMLAWLITLIGMCLLANTFRLLAQRRPELTAGIYSYAQAGFGPLAGFEITWGYWLSAVFGNVAFAVLVIKTCAYFFPALAGVNNWRSIAIGSLLIWIMHFIALLGVKRTAVLNVIFSTLNIMMIAVALAVMAATAKAGLFRYDFWGQQTHLGGVLTQIKSTMLVTLWVFIGIEGAVVVSARAAKPAQVSAATFFGLAICAVLYFLLSALPFGLMQRAALAKLDSPAIAYVLKAAVGGWGAVFITVSLLISLCNSWLAWTVLTAELPYEGAKGGVFPQFLARKNRFDAAAPSLWLSSMVMQAALLVVRLAHDAWLWLISVTGVMILPAYLASAAYLWREAASTAGIAGAPAARRRESLWTSAGSTLYASWLLYAAGPKFLLLSTILFAAGLPVYWQARRGQAKAGLKSGLSETITSIALASAAIAAAFAFATHIVQLG